jgi:hypothetical protein
MKFAGLAALTFVAMLSTPTLARADVLNPPGGPVVVDDDTEAARTPVNDPGDRGQQQNRRQQRGDQPDRAEQRARRQAMRAAIVRQFDVNGDGKLGPRERRRAVRILRRIEAKLAAGGDQRGGNNRMRRFIKRYDVNGDGNVGPREMPPGAADRLRRFDRNGDGWVEPGEVRQ